MHKPFRNYIARNTFGCEISRKKQNWGCLVCVCVFLSYFCLCQAHRSILMSTLSNKQAFILVCLCLWSLTILASSKPFDANAKKPISKIAFGSCNKHDKDQSIWRSILNVNPDLFVWLGDIVYADDPIFPLIWVSNPPEKMAEKYRLQKNHVDYRSLREKAPIVGVWVRR